VNSTNSVLGTFCRTLAMTLDPTLSAEWRRATGARRDWVVFACSGGRRWNEPSDGDVDPWVFVMREPLARALDSIGVARYQEISEDAAELMRFDAEEDKEDENDDADDDPFAEIEAAADNGEFDDLSATERETICLARVGQGAFRADVLAAWGERCAVTGTAVLAAIVASHIKPWAHCTNAERLDPANGLPLIGTIDRLFDYGLITFASDGSIVISTRISEAEYANLHIRTTMRLRKVSVATAEYLTYHRAECFWSESDDTEADDGSYGLRRSSKIQRFWSFLKTIGTRPRMIRRLSLRRKTFMLVVRLSARVAAILHLKQRQQSCAATGSSLCHVVSFPVKRTV
jgi:hypothetical protein